MYYTEKVPVGKFFTLTVCDWLGHEIDEYGWDTYHTRKEAERAERLIREVHPDYHITIEENTEYEVYHRFT